MYRSVSLAPDMVDRSAGEGIAMRPQSEFEAALQMFETGLNNSEISRHLNIPRGTIRDWRQTQLDGAKGRTTPSAVDCFRCSPGYVDSEAYAYLLGVYLGDGCISDAKKGVFRLRIVCDLKYPGIIDEIATHVVILHPRGRSVGFVEKKGCVEIYSYWKHWPCLFPQHGIGRKHERRIALEPWQRAIVSTHPKNLIRGLIHSDGNRHINQVQRMLRTGLKQYRYPRYVFTNASPDILGIFTDALGYLDVKWTRMNTRDISIARRSDVALLDTFVGPKG